MALVLDSSSHKAVFFYIYNPHYLKVLPFKRKVSIFNMGQQRLQFVLLLTAIHRIRLVALCREIPSTSRDQAKVVQGIARTSD